MFDKSSEIQRNTFNSIGKKKISLDLPANILIKLDIERKKIKSSRTSWIVRAILEKLSNDLRKEGKQKATY
jgi:metal-responsive CopG/Arc/MetJ family transcriptional regulator